MSRYIDADALKDFPIRIDHYDQKNGNEHFVYGIETVIEYVDNLPIADVVEVVRCRDCCHYKQNPWNKEDELLCQCWGDWLPTEPDDFCSYGAKMDGDKL